MRPAVTSLLSPFAASTVALRNGAIRRVMFAFFAFNAVELGAWTAILVYAYGATGAASVGVVALSQLLPSAVVAPLIAGLGDRASRAAVLRGWYVVQAAVLAAVGIAILAGMPAIVVYAVSALAVIAMTQTRPVQGALLPELAETPDELTAGNALGSIGEGIGGFAGPLVVGILLAFADPSAAFLVASAVMVAAGLLLVGVGPRGHVHRAGPDGDDADAEGVTMSSGALLAGLRLVLHDPDLLVVMALLTGRLVIFGGLEVLIVLMAIDLLGLGESGAGFLMGVLGLGIISGGTGALALVGRQRIAPWLAVAAVVVGLPVAVIGLVPEAHVAAILLVVAGIGLALLDVSGQTLLQRITPDTVRARVFGVLEGLLLAGEAFGSVAVAPVAAVLGLAGAAVALGLLLPVAALLAVRRFARLDARVHVPIVQLRALRAVPMLAPLRPAAIEGLAWHLVRVEVAPGDVVIREGEPGDRWYLVIGGRFRVTIGGRPVNEMGAGDAFGEIALLRDIPRTATVEATEPGALWALSRDEFLAAVTGSPAALIEADRMAAARLG